MGIRSQKPYVTFSLGLERFCAAAGDVNEVMRPAGYTHLPGAPTGVLGVMNVRGKIIPVIDAAQPLLGQSKDDPSSGIILILSSTYGEIGLLVDDVQGILDHESKDVSLRSTHHESMVGTIERNGTRLKLVDLSQVIESTTALRIHAGAAC